MSDKEPKAHLEDSNSSLDKAHLVNKSERLTLEQLLEVRQWTAQFLFSFCNEIRTPISSIIGFSNVILAGVDGPTTELQKEDLAIIKKGAGKILSQVEKLFLILRLDSEAFDSIELSRLKETNLKEIVSNLNSKYQALIEIQTDIPDNLPTLCIDPHDIERLLLYIVSALSENFQKGPLLLAASGDDNRITIKITNPSYILSRYSLEAFAQAESAPTLFACDEMTVELCASRVLVKRYNGKMSLDSQKETGTAVTLALPREPQLTSSVLI